MFISRSSSSVFLFRQHMAFYMWTIIPKTPRISHPHFVFLLPIHNINSYSIVWSSKRDVHHFLSCIPIFQLFGLSSHSVHFWIIHITHRIASHRIRIQTPDSFSLCIACFIVSFPFSSFSFLKPRIHDQDFTSLYASNHHHHFHSPFHLHAAFYSTHTPLPLSNLRYDFPNTLHCLTSFLFDVSRVFPDSSFCSFVIAFPGGILTCLLMMSRARNTYFTTYIHTMVIQ